MATFPPRRWGGNIDCKELVAGASLFLPISVDGALLSVGDGHAAQGDGEVSATAIECPLDHAQITVELRDLDLGIPIARTRDAWLAFGFDEDLDVAVDLRVTQVVNVAKGVHAVLRDDGLGTLPSRPL